MNTHETTASPIATAILASVDNDRLHRGVEGLVGGAYLITLAMRTEEEIRGFVTNGDGKEYGVVLGKGHAFCSCKDAIYRKGLCKHSVILALSVIRTPHPEQEAKKEDAPRPLNLKLAKVKRTFQTSMI